MTTGIIMYESELCGYCRAAKTLLAKKGWAFKSIIIDGNSDKWDEMVVRSGRDTVPQIYFGEHHIGGFDDLAELDSMNELDALHEQFVISDATGE